MHSLFLLEGFHQNGHSQGALNTMTQTQCFSMKVFHLSSVLDIKYTDTGQAWLLFCCTHLDLDATMQPL